MGRGILSLKLIPNPKSRRTTFLKRKKSLIKKAYELSTLCDVQTCLFIASDCDPSTHFETWPPNHHQIHQMIRSYKSHSFTKPNSSYDLNRFFSDRKNKILTNTSKLLHNVVDHQSEHQLMELLDALDSKIRVANDMIEFMEADYDHLIDQAIGMDTPPSQTEDEETTQFNVSDLFNEPDEFEEYNVEGFQSLLEDKFLETLVQNNPIPDFDFDFDY
ncbi:agamous-like MADS-box protein AGL82 [Cucumis sativus]|uniref:MADS-box domain-containing protein n=1 Tax=Cucumis sativus TaxID=3659 RepID=A0A0A0LAL9_CUCSA|nr:agamous-like MADS-box protein AGL82 [Cucumis sativus]